MSQAQKMSEVLVGGFKPEDIQQAYLQRKAHEEAERRKQGENQATGTKIPSAGIGSTQTSSTSHGPFTIQQFADSYRIGTLLRAGKKYIVDISRGFALDGEKMTQKEWHDWGVANRNQREFRPITPASPGEWFMGTATLYMALFQLLRKGDKSSTSPFLVVAQAHGDLGAIVKSNSLLTSTSIDYYPAGVDDRVFQGLYFDSQVTGHSDLTGPLNLPVRSFELTYDRFCAGVFEQPASIIEELSNWLSGFPPHINRPASKPAVKESYAVAIGPTVFHGIGPDEWTRYCHIDAAWPTDVKGRILPVRFASIEPVNQDGDDQQTTPGGSR